MPVPLGPHTTKFSRRCTHSRVCSPDWVARGMEDSDSSQASKVLPVDDLHEVMMPDPGAARQSLHHLDSHTTKFAADALLASLNRR